ncbi:hypothetical protein Mal35_02030 [Gimesia maris]|nr:hypothetical protein Mal35_02030 [Gimesia maris]
MPHPRLFARILAGLLASEVTYSLAHRQMQQQSQSEGKGRWRDGADD